MQFCFLTKFFIIFVLNSSGDQSSREKLKKNKNNNKKQLVGETDCIMGTLRVADYIFSAQSPLLVPWDREKKQATLTVSELS